LRRDPPRLSRKLHYLSRNHLAQGANRCGFHVNRWEFESCPVGRIEEPSEGPLRATWQGVQASLLTKREWVWRSERQVAWSEATTFHSTVPVGVAARLACRLAASKKQSDTNCRPMRLLPPGQGAPNRNLRQRDCDARVGKQTYSHTHIPLRKDDREPFLPAYISETEGDEYGPIGICRSV